MNYEEIGSVLRAESTTVLSKTELTYSKQITTFVESSVVVPGNISDQLLSFGMNATYVRISVPGKIAIKVNSGTEIITVANQIVLTGDAVDYFTQLKLTNSTTQPITVSYIVGA